MEFLDYRSVDYRDRGGYDLFIATVAQERWEELKKREREREREREERGISEPEHVFV